MTMIGLFLNEVLRMTLTPLLYMNWNSSSK